ncbi:MAG: hypothetical protein V8S58_05175 [Lachnospiraceae bacterium]
MVGTNGTAEQNAKELLPYGVDEVFVYGHEGFAGFKADCYADAVADCISKLRLSAVLVGGTSPSPQRCTASLYAFTHRPDRTLHENWR